MRSEVLVNEMMHQLPLKVAAMMREFKASWFVAGGWAIDLYLGQLTRPHEDIEVAIFREDQSKLHDYLKGWLLQKVVNGERSIWREGERLELPVHEIDCFNRRTEPQRLEILLNESNEYEWLYRRNKDVRRPLVKINFVSNDGVKFLCPEVVLLYKSKNPRAKDEQDFSAVVKHLEPERREWLRNALATCDPSHHWLQNL